MQRLNKKKKSIDDDFKVLVSFSLHQSIGLTVRMFANGPGDWSSIPSRIIPKTQKMVLDAALLNTQHYKGRIKGKVNLTSFQQGNSVYINSV